MRRRRRCFDEARIRLPGRRRARRSGAAPAPGGRSPARGRPGPLRRAGGARGPGPGPAGAVVLRGQAGPAAIDRARQHRAPDDPRRAAGRTGGAAQVRRPVRPRPRRRGSAGARAGRDSVRGGARSHLGGGARRFPPVGGELDGDAGGPGRLPASRRATRVRRSAGDRRSGLASRRNRGSAAGAPQRSRGLRRTSMSEMNHPQALGSTRLGFADEAELDRFVAKLEEFERGELAPDSWRAFRLVHGVYGQRQDGPMMVRCKIPQGVLTPEQLLALAEVSERWSNGKGHITTRQNVQFHFVKMDDVEAVLRRLGAAGLTTREACGNSVRNITGCPYAGVSEQEPFDVTPYAEAMTRHLLRG